MATFYWFRWTRINPGRPRNTFRRDLRRTVTGWIPLNVKGTHWQTTTCCSNVLVKALNKGSDAIRVPEREESTWALWHTTWTKTLLSPSCAAQWSTGRQVVQVVQLPSRQTLIRIISVSQLKWVLLLNLRSSDLKTGGCLCVIWSWGHTNTFFWNLRTLSKPM